VKQFTSTLLFLFLVTPISLLSQDSIDVFIANQMQQQRITGLSLGIIKNGEIVKASGYGKANIELNVPVSEKTVFKIASLSKQFIAVGILNLIHQGKLTLDTPVRNIIKNTPDSWKMMTIRHLLNHSSGLPEDPPAFDGMKSVRDCVYIARAFKNKLASRPGTKFQYSNLGYYVLADIIRIVSHQSFSGYMKNNVFDPAGLKATRVTSLEAIVDNRASGYIEDSAQQIKNAPNYIAVRPSGAFLSNITDLLAWEKVMQESRIFDNHQSDTNLTGGFKTSLTMDGEPIYYRYGWMINRVGSHLLAHHGGSLPGFKSVYFRYPEEKTAIIILTNSDQTDAYAIAFGVAELLNKSMSN
jgi:CubicO group peptidase (beta-lactamase class C family)